MGNPKVTAPQAAHSAIKATLMRLDGPESRPSTLSPWPNIAGAQPRNGARIQARRSDYLRDSRRNTSEVMIQTLHSAIVISNTSTSIFLPNRSSIEFPTDLSPNARFAISERFGRKNLGFRIVALLCPWQLPKSCCSWSGTMLARCIMLAY
jgi:hypothetical protein